MNEQQTSELTVLDQARCHLVYERMMALAEMQGIPSGLRICFDGKPGPDGPKFPDWAMNCFEGFGKTIFSPVLKLKPPSGNVINPRSYGRLIGIVDRMKAFITNDVPQLIKSEGAEQISDDKWEQLISKNGLRKHLAKTLERPIFWFESLEKLALQAKRKRLEDMDRIRLKGFRLLIDMTKHDKKQFYKGLEEGYTTFMDENGQFSGDKGRTSIQFHLLAFKDEVEKMRRVLPAKSRKDLYSLLKERFRFPQHGFEWFSDVCDDLKLAMKSPGRPHKFKTSKSDRSI